MPADSRSPAGESLPPLAWRPIEVADGTAADDFGIWTARDPDALLDALDQTTFEAQDERMPYFATLWPAGESLAAALLGGPALVGRRILDLGCGVGAAGLAAALRGADVSFLDWEARALDLVGLSAERLGVPVAACITGDWRTAEVVGPFDRILAADVLYEVRNVEAVAERLGAWLTPGGEAWLADPGRDEAEAFPAAAARAGLRVLARELLPPRPHGVDVTLVRLGR